jgi:hypothetical protein
VPHQSTPSPQRKSSSVNWDTSKKGFRSLCWYQYSFSKLLAYRNTKSSPAAMWASDVNYHLFDLKLSFSSNTVILCDNYRCLSHTASMHMWPLNLKVFESFERYNRPQNGPGSLIPCQSTWDMWWKKRQWHNVFSKHFIFHLSVSFRHVLYSRFIHYHLCTIFAINSIIK